VGSYREVGVDEFVFYWPMDPETSERAPRHVQALETIASETIPALHAAAAAGLLAEAGEDAPIPCLLRPRGP
jgi:hypothetical protein